MAESLIRKNPTDPFPKVRFAEGGKARIICDDITGDYPIVSVDVSGHLRLHKADGKHMNKLLPYYSLILDTPYADFVRGEPVIANEQKEYFSHTDKEGQPWRFAAGRTKWNWLATQGCHSIRKLTPEERAEYTALTGDDGKRWGWV